MKKFFAILLAMTMIFALVACGSTTTDDAAKDDAAKATEAAPAASADSDVQKDFELEDVKQYAKDVDTKGMTFYWVGKVLGGTYELRELLVPVIREGKRVYTSPEVMDLREYCQKEQNTLWDESRRLVNPQKVYVDLSQKLYDLKKNLLEEMSEKALD